MGHVKELEARAAKAEEDLVASRSELAAANDQVSSLLKEKNQMLKESLKLKERVQKRTTALKLVQKEARKSKKLLLLTEDRCYQMGYDAAVVQANIEGFDYMKLLEEGMDDPVVRAGDLDPIPDVSSGEDEAFSGDESPSSPPPEV